MPPPSATPVRRTCVGVRIGRLDAELVEELGRRSVDIVLLTPDPAEDDFARRLSKAAKEHHVIGRHLGRARGRVASARLDVLHYPDLGMDPFTYLLAMARLSPLQTVGWGHPITSGLPSIDRLLRQRGPRPRARRGPVHRGRHPAARPGHLLASARAPDPPHPRRAGPARRPAGLPVSAEPAGSPGLRPGPGGPRRPRPGLCGPPRLQEARPEPARLLQRMARNIPHLAQSIVVVPSGIATATSPPCRRLTCCSTFQHLRRRAPRWRPSPYRHPHRPWPGPAPGAPHGRLVPGGLGMPGCTSHEAGGLRGEGCVLGRGPRPGPWSGRASRPGRATS